MNRFDCELASDVVVLVVLNDVCRLQDSVRDIGLGVRASCSNGHRHS